MHARLSLATALAVALLLAVAHTTAAQRTPLRNVDPGFADAGGVGPGTIAGYADTLPEDIVYGDLDGDGVEEAVIRVESGGTAGTIGFLIFRDADDEPVRRSMATE